MAETRHNATMHRATRCWLFEQRGDSSLPPLPPSSCTLTFVGCLDECLRSRRKESSDLGAMFAASGRAADRLPSARIEVMPRTAAVC